MDRKFILEKDIDFMHLKLSDKEIEFQHSLATYRKQFIDNIVTNMGIPLHLLDVRFETKYQKDKYLLIAHCKAKDK